MHRGRFPLDDEGAIASPRRNTVSSSGNAKSSSGASFKVIKPCSACMHMPQCVVCIVCVRSMHAQSPDKDPASLPVVASYNGQTIRNYSHLSESERCESFLRFVRVPQRPQGSRKLPTRPRQLPKATPGIPTASQNNHSPLY